MIIDRGHLGWGLGTAALTGALTVVYLANNDPGILPWTLPLPAWLGPVPPLRGNVGASPLGLIYGGAALAIFIFAALLGWRRSRPTWKLGPIKLWLKAHIWLTILTVPLVLFHCGFHGGGPMTEFLMALYALVMVSGFWGLALQNILPRLMRDSLAEEVIFEQIPYIRGQLYLQAQEARAKLVELAELSEPAMAGKITGPQPETRPDSIAALLGFLDEEALPFIQTPGPRRSQLRQQRASDELFGLMGLQVAEAYRPLLGQVRELCDEARRLDRQTRLHRWLHAWLLVHAPASLLLVVVTVWHAVAAALTYA